MTALISPLIIESYGLNHLNQHLNSWDLKHNQILIISSPHVFSLWGEKVLNQLRLSKLPVHHFLVPDGEDAKQLQWAADCWKELAQLGCDRQSLIIGLGGGSITDLTGFVAACYMRGIDCLYIPTTLMGMVDAAIGGKTGINFAGGKNLIGVFKAPRGILIDPSCLRTLPTREFVSGLAEIIKYAIISDSSLFEELEREIESVRDHLMILENWIRRCAELKHHIVELDPLDQNNRLNLNYGHTFAHALESVTDYHQYLHGEAVAIGMSCAAYVSVLLNKLSRKDFEKQDRLCRRAGLPTELPLELIDDVIDKMKFDKKSISQKINLILPEKIGKVVKLQNVDPLFLKQALRLKHRESLERTRSPGFTDEHSFSRLH